MCFVDHAANRRHVVISLLSEMIRLHLDQEGRKFLVEHLVLFTRSYILDQPTDQGLGSSLGLRPSYLLTKAKWFLKIARKQIMCLYVRLNRLDGGDIQSLVGTMINYLNLCF